jgi:hypothetical protein
MKKVDTAGMWNIKGNPITHDGVVMYSGKAIDSTGALGLDKDKLYPVYRPFEELCKACESFNGKPLINNHEMIGTEGGLKKPDDKNIGGTIYNVRPSMDQDGVIIADMTIFSKELQDAITDGKVELSLGYWCKYRPEQGEFNGVPFEFVQYDLEGNHIALVDNGRMGSGVRVFDNAEKTLVFDSMEITTMKDKETKDSEALRKLVAGLLKGATDEALAKCKDILDPEKKEEKDEGEKAEEKKSTDEEKKDESKDEGEKSESKEKESKTEDEEKKEENPAESKDEENKTEKKDEGEKSADEGEKNDESKDEEKKSAEDSAPTMKQMLAEYSKRENLYKAVIPYTGAFDCAEMTAVEVAKYAANKLEIATQDGAEIACVENYLKGLSKKSNESTATMDSVSTGRPSSALLKHLGE